MKLIVKVRNIQKYYDVLVRRKQHRVDDIEYLNISQC